MNEPKDILDMSPEEVIEWEKAQNNSNDIYKVSARIKNLARAGGLSLTPAGENLCNAYTHVLKAFYDFAESIPDQDIKQRLIALTRSNEGMCGNLLTLLQKKRQ